MKTKIITTAAASLVVLASCTTGSDEPEAPEVAAPTTAETEFVEYKIETGEPFTVESPDFVAHVTIEDVFRPDSCGENHPTYIGIEADVDVESGDGGGFVLNSVDERTEDGYTKENRAISGVTCRGLEELSATRVRTGEKYRGVLWLQEDVEPSSEILFDPPPFPGEPVMETFVLDLSEIDLTSEREVAEATTQPDPPAAAPESVPAPVAPSFVRCIDPGGQALFSDGSRAYSDQCYEGFHRPHGDPAQARRWTECVIANGTDYCIDVFAPQFQNAPG
ncbi:hypothetical protein ACTHQW_13765 [Dietzia maris]